MKIVGRAGWRKGAACFGALLALFVNLLIPQGYMTGGASHGIVLCTGSGPVMIASDLIPGSHKAPRGPSKPDGPCAFAGHAGPASLADAPVLQDMAFAWQVQAALKPLEPSEAPRPASPPPPAIGPPSLSA